MRSCDAGKLVDEPIGLREEFGRLSEFFVRVLKALLGFLKPFIGFFLRHSQQFDGLCQGLVTFRQLFQPLVDCHPISQLYSTPPQN